MTAHPTPALQALGLFRLVRTPLIFPAISNAWLVVWLTRGGIEPNVSPRLPTAAWDLASILGLTAVLATGLQVFASALNDAIDARHDRLFHPGRPIPLGLVAPSATIILAMIGVLSAIAVAAMLGTVPGLICIMVSTAILLYNTVGKWVPAVGLVFLGLIRAGFMFVPNPGLTFLWPLWLAMTHVISCTAIVYVFQNKRPPLSARQIWFLTAGWFFWSILLLMWMRNRSMGAVIQTPWQWLGPAIPAFVFFLITWRLVARFEHAPRRMRRNAGNLLAELSLLWLILYDVGWLAGAGLWSAAALHAALFIAGWVWSRLLRGPLVDFEARLTLDRAAKDPRLDTE